jgi:hypothetical protein
MYTYVCPGGADIASTPRIEDPGSNPARITRFLGKFWEMLLFIIDLICICSLLVLKEK